MTLWEDNKSLAGILESILVGLSGFMGVLRPATRQLGETWAKTHCKAVGIVSKINLYCFSVNTDINKHSFHKIMVYKMLYTK